MKILLHDSCYADNWSQSRLLLCCRDKASHSSPARAPAPWWPGLGNHDDQESTLNIVFTSVISDSSCDMDLSLSCNWLIFSPSSSMISVNPLHLPRARQLLYLESCLAATNPSVSMSEASLSPSGSCPGPWWTRPATSPSAAWPHNHQQAVPNCLSWRTVSLASLHRVVLQLPESLPLGIHMDQHPLHAGQLLHHDSSPY